MNVTDPIGDMLTRIRNGQASGAPAVEMPHSRIKVDICRILKREGYVQDFAVEGGKKKTIRLYLKYDGDHKPVIRGLKRVSRPGLRRYVGVGAVPQVLGGMGVAVVSTSGGVMTGAEARGKGLGGEVLCAVW
jgi:small subunit ribosomal protein S8